ncbi:nuclear transport factor 2 family protein [Myxococcota bacterium]|nr:nuclear transport factor 2 family protein [Myxococcota bacterium]
MFLSIEDRLMVHEVLSRLDHAVDAQDWDTYMQFFDAQATMDPGFAPPVSGVDAIRGFLVATEGNTSGKRHVVSNVVLDPTEQGVVATSYLTVIEREDIPKVVATAVVRDTLVKKAAGWRVTSHEVRVDPGMFKAYQAAQVGG